MSKKTINFEFIVSATSTIDVSGWRESNSQSSVSKTDTLTNYATSHYLKITTYEVSVDEDHYADVAKNL
jgi:hypothetical protein